MPVRLPAPRKADITTRVAVVLRLKRDQFVEGSHGQGKRPGGQSKTAIKAATTTTKVSVSAVVVGRIGCLAKLKARLVTGLLFGDRLAMQVRIRPADSR